MYQHYSVPPDVQAEFDAIKAGLSQRTEVGRIIPKLSNADTVRIKTEYKHKLESQGMQLTPNQMFRDNAGNVYDGQGRLVQYADGRPAAQVMQPAGTVLVPGQQPGQMPGYAQAAQYRDALLAEQRRRQEAAQVATNIATGNLAMTTTGAGYTTYDNLGNMVQVYHAPMNLAGRILTWQLADGRYADAAGNVFNSMGAPTGQTIDVSRMNQIAPPAAAPNVPMTIVRTYTNGFGVTNTGLMVDPQGRLTGMTEAQFLGRQQAAPQPQKAIFPTHGHGQQAIMPVTPQTNPAVQPMATYMPGPDDENGVPQGKRPLRDRTILPYRANPDDAVTYLSVDECRARMKTTFHEVIPPTTHIGGGHNVDSVGQHFDNSQDGLGRFYEKYRNRQEGVWLPQYLVDFPDMARRQGLLGTAPVELVEEDQYEDADEAIEAALRLEFPGNPPQSADEVAMEAALFPAGGQVLNVVDMVEELEEEEEEDAPAPAPIQKPTPNFYVPLRAPIGYVQSRQLREGQEPQTFPVWESDSVPFQVLPEYRVTGRYNYDPEQFLSLVAIIAMVPREIIVRKESFMRYADHAKLAPEVAYPMGAYEGGLNNILGDVEKEQALAPTPVKLHDSALVAATHEEAYAKAIHWNSQREGSWVFETDVEHIIPSGELSQELVEMIRYVPTNMYEYVARYIAIIELGKDHTEVAGQALDAFLTKWLNETLKHRCPDLIVNRKGKPALEVESFAGDWDELRGWCEKNPDVAGKTMDIIVDLFTREIPRLLDVSLYNDAYHILNSDEDIVSPRTVIEEGKEPVRENYPMMRVRITRWTMVERKLHGQFTTGRISTVTSRELWKLVAGAFRTIDDNSPLDKAGSLLTILTGDGQKLTVSRVFHAPMADVSELFGFTILNVEQFQCA